MGIEKIISDWKQQYFRPIYLFEGEEAYYIDKALTYAEHHLLPESEAAFNLTVFYGKDADWANVMNACKRYPMFAERQVVILKEAQHMDAKNLAKLAPYCVNPLASTIFIIGHKEKNIDKKTELGKALKKNAEIFLSEKIKDYQLQGWLKSYVAEAGLQMNEKSLALLADHVGADLGRLVNEIEKVTVNLGSKKTITEDDIEKYVGVSKEYNAFELNNALAKKDLAKALRIIQYFDANPKAAPLQVILPAMYGYFSKLYIAFAQQDQSENALKPLFYNNIFAAKEAAATMRLYKYEGVEKALLLLHDYNLRSIGVHSADTNSGALLKELVVKLML
jgi:DNA polymerase III subunit delta